ncbi:MAG: DUF1573 domain-containing protein [Rubripirellula sp.]
MERAAQTVLLACCLGLIPSSILGQQTNEPETTVGLPESTVAKLPLLGTVKLSDDGMLKFDAGTHLHRYTNTLAKIQIQNDSDEPVMLSGVTSSCGCMVAKRNGSGEIAVNEAEILVISISLRKLGSQNSTLSFAMGDKQKVVLLKSRVQAPVAPIQQSIRFSPNGAAKLTVNVNDPRIDPDDLKYLIADGPIKLVKQSVVDRTVTLDFSREPAGTSVGELGVVPIFKGRELTAFRVALMHTGQLSIVPSTMYVRTDAESVRFIMRGDVDSLVIDNDVLHAEIHVGPEKFPLDFRASKSGSTLILSGENPFSTLSTDRHTAKVVIGNISLPFTLQLR